MQPRSPDSIGFYHYDFKRDKHVYYVRAPRIEFGIFAGGGAKGAMSVGVIEVFENYYQDSVTEYTLMEGFDCMIGSSVGAMTAAMLASGITSETLKSKSNESGGKELLGTGTLNAFHFDGVPLRNFIRDNKWESIRNRLCQIYNVENIDENMNQLITCLQQDKYHENEIILAPVFDYLHDKNNKGKISFTLSRYLKEFAPKYFKNLIVTATYIGTPTEEGGLYFLSYENTPNLDEVTAAMASGALPKVLNAVEIPIEELKGGRLERHGLLPNVDSLVFVDGGYLNNIPVSCINDMDKNDGFKKLTVLPIVFDESPKVLGQSSMLNHRNSHDGVFKIRKRDKLICDVIPKYGRTAINSSRNNTNTKQETLERIRAEFPQRAILLESDLKTTSFNKAAEDPEKYYQLGKKQTIEQLAPHQDELVCYYEANSIDNLLAQISAEYLLQDLKTLLNIPLQENIIDSDYEEDSEDELLPQHKSSFQNTQSMIRTTLSASSPSAIQISKCNSITNYIIRLDGIKNAELVHPGDKLGRKYNEVLIHDLHDNINNQLNENEKVLNILKILLNHYYDASSSKNMKYYKDTVQKAINYLINASDDVFVVYLKMNLDKYSKLKNMHIFLENAHPDQYQNINKYEQFDKFVMFLELIAQDNGKFWEGKGISKIGRIKIPDLIKEIRLTLINADKSKMTNEDKYYQIQDLIEKISKESKDTWTNETKDLYHAILNCCHLPPFSRTNYLDAFIQKYFNQEIIEADVKCVARISL